MNVYNLELDKNWLPKLVKEKTVNADGNYLDSAGKVAEVINKCVKLNVQAEEKVYIVCTDCKLNCIGICEISHGVLSASFSGAREIFMRALLMNAAGLFILHNHPSGEVEPSISDENTFAALKKAGELMGVKVFDSIIVGREGYYSLSNNK